MRTVGANSVSRSVKPDPGWAFALRSIQALAVHRGGRRAHPRSGSRLEAMGTGGWAAGAQSLLHDSTLSRSGRSPHLLTEP